MSAYRSEQPPTAWPERVTTSDAVPGFVVEKQISVVWGGLGGRPAPHVAPGMSAGDALVQKAIVELAHAAQAVGANAVTGLRLAHIEGMAGYVIAYGNAVWVTPLR